MIQRKEGKAFREEGSGAFPPMHTKPRDLREISGEKRGVVSPFRTLSRH